MTSTPQPTSTDQNRDGTIVPQEQAEGDQITLLKSPLSKSLEDTFTVREEGTSNGRNMRHSKATSDERALIPYKPFRLEDCIMQFSYACTSNGSSLYRRYFRFNACSFPSDVLPNIFSYCDATTLSSCVAGVCREWKQYSEADDLWEHLCRTTFGVSVTQIANCTNAKELYILSHQQLQHICALRGSHIGSGGASIPTVIPMTIPIL